MSSQDPTRSQERKEDLGPYEDSGPYEDPRSYEDPGPYEDLELFDEPRNL